ncbi:hypothetical protein ONE63_001022 [Megalurothrips usitatus]|uniref:MADF domain-containing protein n=1 Tax=Megalurothrips usitatus TaxID=439358 RepID=A0AAV7XAR2_9NEOP|nr:hypothetical protein ONE63_001022 [Megalurothrips usitatus]
MSARSKKFRKEQEISLATEVEKRPILWDCTLDVYRRADLKGDKWADVAAIVGGCTGDDVCKRFKNMRETFQANHRKVREQANKCSGSGTDDMFRPSWFLYRYLVYLAKTCAQAESTSNIAEAEHESEINDGASTSTSAPVNMYFDETLQHEDDFGYLALQQYVFIPDDTTSDDSMAANVVQSAKTDRPSSAPPVGVGTKRAVPGGEDYFFYQKGAGKKSSATLLQSAVKAIEKMASEPLPKMPDFVVPTPSAAEPEDQFSKFISSRLQMLDGEKRKLCENEILQVIMKY